MWKNRNIYLYLLVKIECKHWDRSYNGIYLLYVMLVCVPFSFFCIVVSSLSVLLYSVLLYFWSDEKVCGIHICFWPISFVRAVRLACFVSSGGSAYQNLVVFRDRFGKWGEEI